MFNEQRRHYSRVRFTEGASLFLAGQRIDCEVRDLSLRGALLRCPALAAVARGCPCELRLVLDAGDDVVVLMKGEVAHAEREGDALDLGMVCRDIDLDSITHLRRLVELNLGDSALLARELQALVRG